jgi:acylphosphatase
MSITRHYRVTGRVQGVGFRWFVADAAGRERIDGYVRNLPDGSVEAVAEGEPDAVARFEAALWRGPSRARVDDVRISESEPLAAGDGFSIR